VQHAVCMADQRACVERCPKVCFFDAFQHVWYRHGDAPEFFVLLFFKMMSLNITLFVFNCLIPLLPLDGATILVSTLLSYNIPTRRVGQVALLASFLALTALAVYFLTVGFVSSWRNTSPFVLFMLTWLGWNVRGLYKAYKQDKLDGHPLFAWYKEQPTPVINTLPLAASEQPSAAQATGAAGGAASSASIFANPFGSKKLVEDSACQACAAQGATAAAQAALASSNPFFLPPDQRPSGPVSYTCAMDPLTVGLLALLPLLHSGPLGITPPEWSVQAGL